MNEIEKKDIVRPPPVAAMVIIGIMKTAIAVAAGRLQACGNSDLVVLPTMVPSRRDWIRTVTLE